MSSYFAKIIDRYFLRWIGPDTWATYHPLDMERFYQFVKAIKRYSRNNYGYKIRQNIINAVKKEHPNLKDEYIEEMAENFSSIVHQILVYESSPFPNSTVEMRDPHAVSLHLGSIQVSDRKGNLRPLYTQRQIEEILVKNFGPDWKERSMKSIYGRSKKA